MSQAAETPGWTGPADPMSRHPHPTKPRELNVQDIMSRELITVTTEETIFSAVRKMSENNVSCVMVVEEEMVIGILTDKDVLKGVAGQDREFHRLRVDQRMSSPVEVASPETSVIAAGKLMEAKGIKRLPVVVDGGLVGVVTQTDITRGLISISPLEAISEIMTTDVVTIDTAATIAEAAQVMSDKGISCVIATHHHGVAGILTEKDLLRRVVALHKDPTQVQVVDVMSFPMISVPPNYSVLSAAKKMDMMRLHRLIVMTDNHIYGIITQTDITKAIRAQLEQLERERQASNAELGSLIQYVVEDLERLQVFLNETSNLLPVPTWSASAAPASNPGQTTAPAIPTSALP